MQVSSVYRCVLDFLYAKGQMSASCVTSRECIANRWLQVLLLRLRLESRKSPGRRCLRRSRLVLPLWLTCEEPYNTRGWAAATGIVLAFSVLPLFYALSGLRQVRKLRTLSVSPSTHQNGTFSVSEMRSLTDVPSKTIVFKERDFPELVALPRPRKPKMTWKGRCYFVFALVVVGLYTVHVLPTT